MIIHIWLRTHPFPRGRRFQGNVLALDIDQSVTATIGEVDHFLILYKSAFACSKIGLWGTDQAQGQLNPSFYKRIGAVIKQFFALYCTDDVLAGESCLQCRCAAVFGSTVDVCGVSSHVYMGKLLVCDL